MFSSKAALPGRIRNKTPHAAKGDEQECVLAALLGEPWNAAATSQELWEDQDGNRA